MAMREIEGVLENMDVGGESREYLSVEDELAEMRERRKTFKVFVVEHVRCIVFVRLKGMDPYVVAERLWKQAREGARMFRYIHRIVPIEKTCVASKDRIREVLERIVKRDNEETYRVMVGCRCNTAMNREEVIRMAAEVVHVQNPGWRVDLKHGEISIVIEIVGKMCGIGIVRGFEGWKRGNVRGLYEEHMITTSEI